MPLGEDKTLHGLPTDMRSPRVVGHGEHPEDCPIAIGARVAQYAITALLGAGGMGQVYRARDLRLRREVAIKVLRPDVWGPAIGENGHARLLAEAQAMARLSHPNVITVYEVGAIGDQPFVAMECVDGQTLRAWLRERPRSRREILEVFMAAGRGLAAAHQVDLVHRDFKPDNVLVGRDGQVRVTDFGLAGSTSAATGAWSRSGTPAYMAPEQRLGLALDARADQYAFAVALYEGLCGARPFADDSAPDARRAVEWPRGAPIPSWLRDLLARALAFAPADRHPSMDALLAALAADPARTRRRALAGAGVAGLLAVATYGLVWRPAPACRGAEARLAGVWDDAVKRSMHAAFLASGRPYAEDTYGRVATTLDGYAGAWVAMHRDTCEATAVRHEQSDRLLDLRMACLDRRRGGLGALAAVLAGASDVATLDGAAAAAHGLDAIADCADAAALTSALPLPADPARRARLATVRAELDEVSAGQRAGHYRAVLPRARLLVDAARPLEYPPLDAEAVALLATLEAAVDAPTAEARFYEAIQAAAEAHDDPRIARGWTALIGFLAQKQARHADALKLRPSVEAAVARAGNPPRLRAAMLSSLGVALQLEARGDEAVAYQKQALALTEKELGPDGLEVASILDRVASALRSDLKPAAARPFSERALAILERRLGPDHPAVADALANLAQVTLQLLDCEAALGYATRASAIYERDVGGETLAAARALNLAGIAHYRLGHLDEARRFLARALAVRERVGGPEHVDVALSLTSLASALADAGRLAEAEPLLERAEAIDTKLFGAAHPQVLTVRFMRQDLRSRAGRLDDALAAAQQMVEAQEQLDRPSGLGGVLLSRGVIQLERGALDAARADARRGLAAIETGAEPRPAMLGAAHNLLGQVALAEGRIAEARAELARALPLREQVGLPVPIAETLTGLAECDLAVGRPGPAVAALALARALVTGGRAALAARVDFALARALWTTRVDRARARALADRAREELASLAPAYSARRHAVDVWVKDAEPAQPRRP